MNDRLFEKNYINESTRKFKSQRTLINEYWLEKEKSAIESDSSIGYGIMSKEKDINDAKNLYPKVGMYTVENGITKYIG
jgi:hypothetical protein